MRIKNKRGLEESTIGLIILSVVIILVFLVILNEYYSSIKEKMEIRNCRNSIAAHSMLASSSDYEIFTDIKCPTRYITISTNDNTEAKQKIADDMYRCWYEWGEGKGPYFQEEGYFCHICSVYSFKPAGIQINGFINYLSKETLSDKYAGALSGVGAQITYMDYFQGYKSPNARKMVDNPPSYTPLSNKDDVINTSNKYATVFIHVSGKDEIQEFLQQKKMGATVAGGLAITLGIGAVVGKAAALGGVVSALATGAAVNSWNPVGWVVGGVLVIGISGYLIYEAWTQEEPGWISLITFKPYNAEELNALGCEKSQVNQLSHSTQ